MKLSAAKTNKLYLYLTIFCGLIILLPSFNFQQYFSQGDHGRDLYAFQMSAKGHVPYQDYLWVYGPLMPYYYALFLNLFTDSIQTVIIAELILKFLSGFMIFFILRWLVTPFWSFLASIFFWCFFPYFFYTYNHAGGILLILLATLSIVRYIFTSSKMNIYWGLIPIALLAFVKINFGICMLGAYVLSVYIIDKNKSQQNRKFYWLSLALLPFLIFGIYYALVSGLPKYVIQQCFPFTQKGRHHSLDLVGLMPQAIRFITYYITNSWRDLTFAIIAVFAVLSFIFSYKNIDNEIKENIRLSIIALLILFIACLHEFIPSGVYYRVVWALPLQTIIIFLCLFHALKQLPKIFTVLIVASLAVITFSKLNNNLDNVQKHQTEAYYLNVERGGVVIENSIQWIDTVQRSVTALKVRLSENELFFALPYDPLYYYLLDRESPTYQIVFFDYMNIPEEQELRTIKDLENKNIKWILTSNRIRYVESSMGEFGITNSALLAKYIYNNFETVREFGPWSSDPGWRSDHGIRILKRKTE